MRSMVARPLLGVVMAFACLTGARAGQYLDVMDARLPLAGLSIDVRESALGWDCSNGVSCALAGPLKASVVFDADYTLSGVTSHSAAFNFFVTAKTVDNIIDPLGHSWSVSADMGKWTIGVDIASQTPQGTDPQFASAYGRFSYTGATGLFFVPGQTSSSSTLLGLQPSALAITLGPGSQGTSMLDEQGRYPDEDGNAFFYRWRFATQLDGTRRAYPSTTDVSCSSPLCMEYKTDLLKINSYSLNFDLVATQTAVPELDTAGMMLAGLAGMGWVVSHRRKMVRVS